MDKKIKRAGNITAEQKEVMVEYLRKHPNLLKGKFSPAFSKATAQSLWQQLAKILNAMVGAKKEWHQWRKSWQDLRSNVKSKKTGITKYMRGTGGGDPIDEELTPMEESVLEIIGKTAMEGHPVMESNTVFELPSFSMDDEEENVEENVNYMDHNYTVTTATTEKRYLGHYDLNSSGPSNETASQCNRADAAQIHHYEIENEKALTFTTPKRSNQPKIKEDIHTIVKPPNKFPLQPRNGIAKVATMPIPDKKPKRVVRLDKTISATDTLAEQNAERTVIMREYYQRKLKLMEEDVKVKRDIAGSLHQICEHFNKQDVGHLI